MGVETFSRLVWSRVALVSICHDPDWFMLCYMCLVIGENVHDCILLFLLNSHMCILPFSIIKAIVTINNVPIS